MTFQWIGLLVLLAIVPLLVALYAWSLRRRRPSAARYSSLALIRDAAPGSSRLRRHLPFALVAAAMAALVIALGRPAVVVGVPTNQTTIILSMDVSGSMCSTDIEPTRLEAAEAAADRLRHEPEGATTADRDRRVQRLRGGRPAADDRPEGTRRCDPEPDDRPADRDRQRDPRRDRRDRRGRSDHRPQRHRRPPGSRAAAGRGRRLRAGHHRPAHRRREQRRPGSGRRRPAGGRPRPPGLHDRVRLGRRRRRSTRPAASSSSATSRAAGSAAAGSAVAAAAGSGAGSTSRRSASGRRPHRRRLLPGRERRRARAGLRRPADEPDHEARGRRDQRRVRRARRRCSRRSRCSSGGPGGRCPEFRLAGIPRPAPRRARDVACATMCDSTSMHHPRSVQRIMAVRPPPPRRRVGRRHPARRRGAPRQQHRGRRRRHRRQARDEVLARIPAGLRGLQRQEQDPRGHRRLRRPP